MPLPGPSLLKTAHSMVEPNVSHASEIYLNACCWQAFMGNLLWRQKWVRLSPTGQIAEANSKPNNYRVLSKVETFIDLCSRSLFFLRRLVSLTLMMSSICTAIIVVKTTFTYRSCWIIDTSGFTPVRWAFGTSSNLIYLSGCTSI